jgi:hypothetical protein
VSWPSAGVRAAEAGRVLGATGIALQAWGVPDVPGVLTTQTRRLERCAALWQVDAQRADDGGRRSLQRRGQHPLGGSHPTAHQHGSCDHACGQLEPGAGPRAARDREHRVEMTSSGRGWRPAQERRPKILHHTLEAHDRRFADRRRDKVGHVHHPSDRPCPWG